MSLRESIESDYKTALKSKDKNKISTYRLILSGIKDLDINNRSGAEKKETDDDDIKQLIKKMIKQRNESISIYKKNNRKDLLAVEENEVAILSTYLPKQLGEDEREIYVSVREQIADDKELSKADVKKTIDRVSKFRKDRVDLETKFVLGMDDILTPNQMVKLGIFKERMMHEMRDEMRDKKGKKKHRKKKGKKRGFRRF